MWYDQQFLTLTSTPCYAEVQAVHEQRMLINKAIGDCHAIRAHAAPDMLCSALAMLDLGDQLSAEDGQFYFAESQAFKAVWVFNRENHVGGAVKKILADVEHRLADRYTHRAHQQLGHMILHGGLSLQSAREAYIATCDVQMKCVLWPPDRPIETWHRDLRSRLLLAYEKNFFDGTGYFRSKSTIVAVRKNFPEGNRGIPARPRKKDKSPERQSPADSAD